jgi:hypothetical protein
MHGTISVGPGPFAGLVPLDASYATLPIADAFNWDECLASVERGEWYVVSFRSVRRIGSDDALLEEFDRRAFAEASRHSGLSCYFIGEMDDERRCLSMCVWEDRPRAAEAATLPDHTAAVAIAGATYTSYVLERHRLTKHDDIVELAEIEPPQRSLAVDGSSS